MHTLEIENGDLAKDVVTGFTGIVICVVECLHNCKRIGLQNQELKDNLPTDSQFFDAPQILLLEKRAVDVRSPEIEHTVNLGDIGRDIISGFEGTVTSIAYWLNGCARPCLQSSKLFEGKPVDAIGFPMSQVVCTKKAKVLAKDKVGGPMAAPKRIANPTR